MKDLWLEAPLVTRGGDDALLVLFGRLQKGRFTSSSAVYGTSKAFFITRLFTASCLTFIPINHIHIPVHTRREAHLLRTLRASVAHALSIVRSAGRLFFVNKNNPCHVLGFGGKGASF